MPAANSDKEQALLRGLAAWDSAWASQDADAMRACLADDATLHADGLLFEHDVKGAGAIVDVHRRYFERFQYKHRQIASAANPDTSAAFGFWQDSEVARRGGGAPAEASPGSTILGIWKLVLVEGGSKVREIVFLRQLHREEAERKLQDPGAAAHGGIDPGAFAGEGGEGTPERRAAARKAAELYSDMWQGEGDLGSKSKAVLVEDFEEADLTKGHGLQGRQAFVDMISKMAGTHTGWVSESYSLDIGVSSDAGVAFVHWQSSGYFGENKERRDESWGLSVLVMDKGEGGKIRRTAGFRALGAGEKGKMLRPDAFKHAAQA